MSTYQLFIILHGLKDVLVWLVPLLIAILVCATAFVISFRWIRERQASTANLTGLASRIDEIESRLEEIERRSSPSQGSPGGGSRGESSSAE